MTSRIVRIVVSLLLALAGLSFAEGKAEGVVAASTGDTPTYGGTFTAFVKYANLEPPAFEPHKYWSAAVWCGPYLEMLGMGGIDESGPSGSAAYSFKLPEYIPDQFMTGKLAESWEMTSKPLGVIFHIRKGVMWTGREGVMKSRELTADDVVASLTHLKTTPGQESLYGFVKSITATDQYTVALEFASFDPLWTKNLVYGGRCVIYPRELLGSDINVEDWRNAVGTGPFILTDYVAGSSCTYVKNPNYWGTTKVKNVQYKLPFVDKLVMPIIPDESTQIAALRTGKLDLMVEVPPKYGESLKQTSPKLILDKRLGRGMKFLRLNAISSKVLTNKNIRRALMIGLDLPTISKAIYGEAAVHSFPVWPGDALYTPLEKLPESNRVLYSYDPEMAKKMIADEGYPNGFKLVLLGNAGNTDDPDLADMIVEYWRAIGVDVKVDLLPTAAWSKANDSAEYEDALMALFGTPNPLNILVEGRGDVSHPHYSDPQFAAKYKDMVATVDSKERGEKIKQLGYYMMDNVPTIPIANGYVMTGYWPWLKNYNGEIETGFLNQTPIWARLWIDQGMKKSMGF